ncbi:MAG TPA: hypothetical protein VLJ41_13455 [Segetibacter sp.]|nr:hypothetical protein [Segetibacter sp.]
MVHTPIFEANSSLIEQKSIFTPHSGQDIGYEKGAKMVKRYFDQNDEEISANFLGRNIIEAILAQPGAVGITVITGINELGQPTPVLVGVNSKGDYILNVTTVGANGQLSKEKGIVAGGGVLSTGVPPTNIGWD